MRNVVQLFWLQILFCSCVNETTLAPACNHGRSLCQLRREQFGIFTRSKEQWKYEEGTKVAYNVFWEYLKWKKNDSHSFHQKKSWYLLWENSTLKCGKGMVSFAPNLHLSGYVLAFSSSSVHTRLISSKTLSFLEPMQFIKRKFQSLNRRKSSLTTQTTNKQRWQRNCIHDFHNGRRRARLVVSYTWEPGQKGHVCFDLCLFTWFQIKKAGWY